MAIFGKISSNRKTGDELDREKRSSEWQRATMLPDSAQREAVQARMIADPYDREASTRLERINSRMSGGRIAPRAMHSAALQEYNESGATLRGEPMANSDNYSQGQRRLQRGSMQGGGLFTTGRINDKDVVVPTAGHYSDYRSALTKLGLDESPSPEAFGIAMGRYGTDPNASGAMEAAGNTSYMTENAWRTPAYERELAGKRRLTEKNKAAMQKNDAADRRIWSDAGSKLSNMQSKDGYDAYMKSYHSVLKANKDATPDELSAALDDAGVQYSSTESVKLGRKVNRPGLVARSGFNAYKADPGRGVRENAVVEGMNSRLQGNPRAEELYNSASREAYASVLPAPPQLQEAGAAIDAHVQRMVQRGATPEQALQDVLERTANDPEKHALAVEHFKRHAARSNDRILKTQVPR